MDDKEYKSQAASTEKKGPPEKPKAMANAFLTISDSVDLELTETAPKVRFQIGNFSFSLATDAPDDETLKKIILKTPDMHLAHQKLDGKDILKASSGVDFSEELTLVARINDDELEFRAGEKRINGLSTLTTSNFVELSEENNRITIVESTSLLGTIDQELPNDLKTLSIPVTPIFCLAPGTKETPELKDVPKNTQLVKSEDGKHEIVIARSEPAVDSLIASQIFANVNGEDQPFTSLVSGFDAKSVLPQTIKFTSTNKDPVNNVFLDLFEISKHATSSKRIIYVLHRSHFSCSIAKSTD